MSAIAQFPYRVFGRKLNATTTHLCRTAQLAHRKILSLKLSQCTDIVTMGADGAIVSESDVVERAENEIAGEGLVPA